MLDISLNLLFICSGVVLFTLVFLKIKVYEPIMGQIDLRERTIKNCELSTQKNNEKIQKLQEEIDLVLKTAKEEAYEIRQKATKDAKEAFAEFKNDLNATLDKDYNSFCDDLEKQKSVVMESLQKQSNLITDTLKKKITV